MKPHGLGDRHATVLLVETVEMIRPGSGTLFVDATLGLGGHTELLLENNPDARVIGIDHDRSALDMARERLGGLAARVDFAHGNFSELNAILDQRGIAMVDGIIADLGVSSMQVDSEERGFSFRFDAPLDMRMDPDSGNETAADLLDRLTEEEIANIIYTLGEERASRKIARRIVGARRAGNPIRTTFELKKLIESCVWTSKKAHIHPATRTFQALRIAVNSELDVLEEMLGSAAARLAPGARVAVISFHSLEDRIVKRAFLKMSGKCECPPRLPRCICGAKKIGNIITRKPITPSEEETNNNPRARSAKLRVFERIAD
jgi:16S rRNA (cytosine1402-N4)-methyltransferase